MQKTVRFLVLVLLTAPGLWLAPQAFADGEVPAGSELRKELFALARPQIERVAGQAVRFQGSMKQLGDWVFFQGTIRDASGDSIHVGPAESAETAILWVQRKGKWTVVEAETGFTDVIWLDWPKKHQTPPALFE